MDIMQKNRLLIWLVVILVLINLLSVGTFWFGFFFHKPPQMRPFRGPEEMIERELGLTEQQKAGMRQEMHKHFESVRVILDSVKTLKREAFALITQHPEDTVQAEILLKKTADCLIEADRMRYKHFLTLRKMCSPEQQKSFDRLLQDMLQEMPPPRPEMFGKPPVNQPN